MPTVVEAAYAAGFFDGNIYESTGTQSLTAMPKRSFRLIVTHTQASEFFGTILPYLHVKADAVSDALFIWQNRHDRAVRDELIRTRRGRRAA